MPVGQLRAEDPRAIDLACPTLDQPEDTVHRLTQGCIPTAQATSAI
jgi:hypothetical protein